MEGKFHVKKNNRKKKKTGIHSEKRKRVPFIKQKTEAEFTAYSPARNDCEVLWASRVELLGVMWASDPPEPGERGKAGGNTVPPGVWAVNEFFLLLLVVG